MSPEPFSAPATQPDTDVLEGPISHAEVERALPQLANGKAAGQAGWLAELLRCSAYYLEDGNGRMKKIWIVAPLLTDLLNSFFLHGSIPACVSSGLVTPIHKKGCSLDPANYRPIAVGEPLYRLYTIILNARLVHWTEEHGLRSPAQAGFRPIKSAVHHLFALRHFIDHARLVKRPLYTCFVDLQKAYDTVQHDLLWARLRHIGVSPCMFAAIQSIYSSGPLAMKINGIAGQPAVQRMGVRQGCPLSPTLFGIFFDGLHDHLHACAPSCGVQLKSGRWVSSLVYADDVALLSFTSQGLQQLIDGMHGFCTSMGLTISPTKTDVVVFNGADAQVNNGVQSSWHVAGQQLPVSCSFKYLGLTFHESGSMAFALARLLQNGQGARSRLTAKYRELCCDKSFPMMRRPFDAVVKPTVSYGSEIWGTFSAGKLSLVFKGMADLQLAFFRHLGMFAQKECLCSHRVR